MANTILKKHVTSIKVPEKKVAYKYVEVTFQPSLEVDAEIDPHGENVNPEKAVKAAAEEWFKKDGVKLLGFSEPECDEKTLTASKGAVHVVFKAKSKTSATELKIDLTLCDLAKLQGVPSATITGKFPPHHYDPPAGKGVKLKLVITPQLEATAKPNMKEIATKVLEEVVKKYGKKEAASLFGKQALELAAKLGVGEAGDLLAVGGADLAAEGVVITVASGAVIVILAAVVVAFTAEGAYQYFAYKDIESAKGKVAELASAWWKGYQAGLLGHNPPSFPAAVKAHGVALAKRQAEIAKLKAKHKGAHEKAVEDAFNKEVMKHFNSGDYYGKILAEARKVVWKEYYDKYKTDHWYKSNLENRKTAWLYIWDKIPDGDPEFQKYAKG